MEIKYKISNKTLHLYFFGELDEHSSKLSRDVIDRLILGSGVETVIFELKSLDFADSTGIGLLIGRYKKLKALGKTAYIRQPNSQIEKVFKTTGIFSIIPKIS